jgi:hypothetical protein
MAAEVLKSYLVELGWSFKRDDFRRLNEAIGGTESLLRRFGGQLLAGATAVTVRVKQTAEELDRLYFAAQRVGSTVPQLQQFTYAGKQIGISSGEISSAISSIGIALRMPGEGAFLRGLGVQSNDAATALDQLIGRLRQMPYFVGQNFAEQFGIGPQAFHQFVTQYDEFHKQITDIRRRAAMAGNTDADARAANDFMTSWRRLLNEIEQIEQKVFRALVTPLKLAVDGAEGLLERFSRLDDTTTAIAATLAAAFGVGGTLAIGAAMLRRLLGTAGEVAGAMAPAAGAGAELSAAARALVGSAAALNEAAAALKLSGGIGGGAGGAAGAAAKGAAAGGTLVMLRQWANRLFRLGGPIAAFLAAMEPSAANPGEDEAIQRLQNGTANLGWSTAQHEEARIATLQGWWRHNVLRGSVDVGQDPSEDLRAWLRGASGFVPRVRLDEGAPGSRGTSTGDWGRIGGSHEDAERRPREVIRDTINSIKGFLGKTFGIGAAQAALPPNINQNKPAVEGGGQVPQGTRLNLGMLKQLALDIGFIGEDANIMAATAMGESGGDPFAHGDLNLGSGSFGVTQIYSGAHSDAKKAYGDPVFAMRKAFQLYQARREKGQRGFEDWSVWKSGAYRKYLDAAREAIPQPYPTREQLFNVVQPSASQSNAMTMRDVNRLVYALGDSIAEGVGAAGNLEGSRSKQSTDRDREDIAAVWGRTPRQVLGAIQGQMAKLGGKTVLLSSGASNDPTQLEYVREQISLLRQAGANAVLLGVGTGVKNYREINEKLKAIATDAGIPFGGELPTTEGGRVHPRDYKAVLDQALKASNLTNPRAPWNDDNAGALVPGGALGRQSNITINMDNDFNVSGFDRDDVSREVLRGLGRTNADLVRNLRTAVA